VYQLIISLLLLLALVVGAFGDVNEALEKVL
jgi:hypothetical protein